MSRVVTCCVWLILFAISAQAADDACGRLVTDALKSLGIADIEKFPPNRCVSTTGQAVNSLQGINGDVAAAVARVNTALGNRDDPDAKTVQGLLKDLTGGDNPLATQLKKKADALEQTLFKMGLLMSADGSTAGQAVDSLLGMKGGVSVAADQIKTALGDRSGADAKAAQDLLRELSNGDSAVAAQLGKKAETLKQLLAKMGLLSEGASPECAAVQKVIRAGQICQTLQATLQTRIEALTTAATAVGKANDLAVCEDKARRLPDFLAQQYGLLAKGKFPKLSDEPGSEFAVENQLIITHARYGDIFNEDRDYKRDEGKKSVRYLPRREPTTPRADTVFTDPEDFADILNERGWERHRHTCDLTYYFRRECRPKPWTKEDTSWAGSTYCHIRDTGLKDLCGYDPSPQGIKQFHIQYSCNELDAKNQTWTTRYLRELKFPAQTKGINIICELPETGLRDMQWEVTYFTTDPCKISMPALAAAGSPGGDNKPPEQAPKNPAQPQPAPGAPPKKQ